MSNLQEINSLGSLITEPTKECEFLKTYGFCSQSAPQKGMKLHCKFGDTSIPPNQEDEEKSG